MNWLVIAFAFIGLLLLFTIIIDTIYHFNNWQKRIHIGRWNNEKVWAEYLKRKSCKWLLKTPCVPKNDNERLILLDYFRGEYNNSTIQSWQVAGLILGLRDCEYTHNKHNISKILAKFSKTTNIDRALLSYSLMKLKTNDNELKHQIAKFAHETWNIILSVKGDKKTIPYRQNEPQIRYVDTIGLVCPFLALYGLKYDCKKALEICEAQIKEYVSFNHPITLLPPHAYNLDHMSAMGLYDWGRGIGWYSLGLCEVKRVLVENKIINKAFISFLDSKILELAKQLKGFILPNGGLSSIVTNTTSFPESSSTVLSALLFLDAYKISDLPEYMSIVNSSVKILMKLTRRDGSLDMCQGDTKGIGFYSTRYNIMPFAQGLTLLLYKRLHAHN